MAGSFGHVTDEDTAELLNAAQIVDMLEGSGDWIECVRDMYGMIVWLAYRLCEEQDDIPNQQSVLAAIRLAADHYGDVVLRGADLEDAGRWLFADDDLGRAAYDAFRGQPSDPWPMLTRHHKTYWVNIARAVIKAAGERR